MIDLDVLTEVEVTTDSGQPTHTHIVDRGDDQRTAAAIVMEARINGTPLTALCGHIFVPSRDPYKFPPCPKCMEIYEFAKDFRGF